MDSNTRRGYVLLGHLCYGISVEQAKISTIRAFDCSSTSLRMSESVFIIGRESTTWKFRRYYAIESSSQDMKYLPAILYPIPLDLNHHHLNIQSHHQHSGPCFC